MDTKDRIVESLIKELITDHYPHGVRLPSERDLCIELNSSRSSLREALSVLANWNVIVSEKGSGIRVMGKDFWHMQTIPYLIKYEIAEPHYPHLVNELLTMRRKIFVDALSLIKPNKKIDLIKAKGELEEAWKYRKHLAQCTHHESNFIREILIGAKLRAVILLWNSISEIYVSAARMIPQGISVPEDYFRENMKFILAIEKGRIVFAKNHVNRYLKKQDEKIMKFIHDVSLKNKPQK